MKIIKAGDHKKAQLDIIKCLICGKKKGRDEMANSDVCYICKDTEDYTIASSKKMNKKAIALVEDVEMKIDLVTEMMSEWGRSLEEGVNDVFVGEQLDPITLQKIITRTMQKGVK